MAIEVVRVDLSFNMEVNELARRMPEVIRRQVRVAPDSYKKITYGYKFGSSKNWDEVAAECDLTAFYYGDPTSHPIEVILAWLDKKLARMDYLRGEGSILSFVYTKHIYPPTVVQWAICTAMAKRGDARFEKYVEPLRVWLRAGLGYMTIAAWPVRMRSMTQEQITLPPSPRTLIANGPPSAWFPPVSLIACGKRGWDGEFKSGPNEWLFGSMLHKASRSLSDLALGNRKDSDDLMVALRAKGLMPGELLTDEEKLRVRAAMANSVADLDWCVEELIGPWGVGNAVEILRTTEGVTCLMDDGDADPETPDGSPGPTSAMVGSTLLKSGVGYAMGCDSAHRGTGKNRAHEAWTDLGKRKAYCQAIGGTDERPVIEMPMAPGAIVWHRWFVPGGTVLRLDGSAAPSPTPAPPAVEPQPSPSPSPTPAGDRADAFDWLVNAGANLAAVGAGFYGTISPLAGFPHLFVCRLSAGEVPWASTLLWRDEAGEMIRLVAECGYRTETGELGNVRTFWSADGSLGVRWLPRWIDRGSPMLYRDTGLLVERAVLDGHGPYRPDGSRLAAGEIQEARLNAAVELVHVGVTQQLGESAAVVRRTDTMGVEPANVEQYEIGFGRGAYGVVRWQSWERRVHKRDERATRIEPAGVPARIYGIDPLDPELRERWFATSGYSGALPNVSRPTQRPTVESKPSGGSMRSGGGCSSLIFYAALILSAGAALAATILNGGL